MNKKGFTLTELLTVIVILAIIALIAVPIVMGIIESSRGRLEAEQKGRIEDAARRWAVTLTVDSDCVSVATLIGEGFLEADDDNDRTSISNPGGGRLGGGVTVVWDEDINQFNYTYVNGCP